MSALIEVDALKKSFLIPSARRDTVREHLFNALRPRRFETLTVLDGISFSIPRGQTVGLMGRNGSGKSTLLKILAGIYHPDAGSVRVGAPLTPILELGLGWNPELTARDNIFLTGTAMGMELAQVHADLDEILAFAELERFVDTPLKFFSSGMGARLAYAIAFRAVREILLLDEIFAVGDAAFIQRCQARYREMRAAGHTILLVSHDPDTIAEFCQRALLIEGGRLLLDDSGEKVAAAYLQLMREAAGG
jgi:ABC-type polysaccharide/polyol phosphate transport system ATPase subunit